MTSNEEVRHDLGVLRDAANAFDRLADAMHAADGGLGDDQFYIPDTAWASVGDSSACRDAYADIRTRMRSVVREGGDAVSVVASQIRRAADNYEAENDRQAAEMERLRQAFVDLPAPDRPRGQPGPPSYDLRAGAEQIGTAISNGASDFADRFPQMWAAAWDSEADTSEAREVGESGWLEVAPILDLSKTLWPALDRGTQQIMETIEHAQVWSANFWRIGDVANAWKRFGDSLDGYDGLGNALSSATGDLLREWTGPAARELDRYMTYDLMPRIPALADLARGISSALGIIFGAYRDFWRAVTDGAASTKTAIAGALAGSLASGGAALTIAGAGVVAGFASYVGQCVSGVVESGWKTEDALGALDNLMVPVAKGSDWAQPGQNLSDGARKDGDRSDWSRS